MRVSERRRNNKNKIENCTNFVRSQADLRFVSPILYKWCTQSDPLTFDNHKYDLTSFNGFQWDIECVIY